MNGNAPIDPRSAHVLSRLRIGRSVDGDLAAVADPFRPLAERLADADPGDRRTVMDGFLGDWPDRDKITLAVASVNPDDPMPEAEPEGADEWGPLRLGTPPPAEPFPAHVFPDCLRRYCEEAATALLAPLDFVGVTMLAVAGAAIGQSVNLRLKRTWTEAPLLYMIPVAKPGRTKTPAIKAVVRPLTGIDRELRKQSQEDREAWIEAKKRHDKDPNTDPPGPEPPQLRAVVKDVTRESLVIVLRDNPRGVFVDPDEATAWIASFNEYKAKGADRQFWLSIWSCVAVSVDRKGGRESTYVPFPFASVVGGMPPAMLDSLADERGRDDGFIDRILFSYPDDDAFPPQRWNDDELSEDAEADWTDTIRRLHATPMVDDSAMELERPFFVGLTPEARSAWADWFGDHSAETEALGFPDRQAGPWSKMRTHAARFALILSRLRWGCDPTAPEDQPGPVTLEDIRGAIALADYFKSHLSRVLHEATRGAGSPDARAILRWIGREARESFPQSDLTRDFPRFRSDPDALNAALAELIERNALRRRPDPERPKGTPGRKPLPTYDVHPSLRAPENRGNRENAPHGSHSRDKSNSPEPSGERIAP